MSIQYSLFIILLVTINVQATWWGLGLQSNLFSSSFRLPEQNLLDFCTSMNGYLTAGQTKLCQLYSDHMTAVSKGAKIGIVECQWQFRYHQWNCSTISNQTVFGTAVNSIATRESAFVHAITAAGVLQAIARSCRNGEIGACGCSNSKRPSNLNKDWVWGGCGDNVEYGYKFTKTFVDITEKSLNDDRYSLIASNNNKNEVSGAANYKILDRFRKSKGLRSSPEQRTSNLNTNVDLKQSKARRLINLHNNEAGRRAVYRSVKIECKCHGVSGSCSMKTCWLKLPSFREVGDYLKDKFDSAIEVKYESKQQQLRARYKRFSKPTREDLIFIEESPNYCNINPKTGSLGTHGRQCNRNSNGPDGCKILCCGRGYYIQKTIKEEKCKCKFKWCCEISCETCITEVETYICK